MLLRTICGLSLLVSCLIFWLCSCSLWILPLLFLGCFLGLLLTAFLLRKSKRQKILDRIERLKSSEMAEF